jgi:hypothetical protein|tara:strand:- start:134 stop:469 length:336 start_codon:yes stop_codon:yes gene_type:complete
MSDQNEWDNPQEEGVTLGPEEALQKEIEKNKALKVERLRLQNKIEELQSENSRLSREKRKLSFRVSQFQSLPEQDSGANQSSGENFKQLISLLISVAAAATLILFLFFLFL